MSDDLSETCDPSMGIDLLDQETLSLILGNLTTKECSLVACVRKTWRDFVEGHPMWRDLLLARYGQEVPIAPKPMPSTQSENVSSFKEAFIAWETEYGGYGEFFARGWRCWSLLESWTQAHFEPVFQSLGEGASEAQLDTVERALKVTLPRAMRMMYRVHDGQNLAIDRTTRKDESIYHGLFGGYRFYNHLVCVRLLPLKLVEEITNMCRQQQYLTTESKIVIAACKTLRKLFILDTADGKVYAACMERQLLQASPSSTNGDGLLSWMEAYAANLVSGKYEIAKLIEEDDNSRTIVLYPRCGEGTSVAVTQGVKIEAGAVLIPERSTPPNFFFSYSIRFSLTSVEEQRAETGETSEVLESTQLVTRHWVITDGENGKDEVRGEAVIGEYPLLRPGQPPFIYQSCTSMSAVPGVMEGDFRFVRGTIEDPYGDPFDAMCAPFALAAPDALF
eukprot:CAMPEP_0198216936 /NCGR_PEP_ID=MMETSP1445-20131203/60593_1 /TAXON_ID=36898 /ORGANISM="Pyramimonas sp., Strain CCMP2087" /LENGTH=448 /DNA_ID=CAMNT_0043893391 /DNA_START=226 /DNA_END=1572 /DNA_ORIENTATION=-